jgi:hypothetical protein
MKCLEKDRTRRYETANGLAMDLRRHWITSPWWLVHLLLPIGYAR